MIDPDLAKNKASRCRSNWRSRAKRAGVDLDTVPTRKEIQDWIEKHKILHCYLTGEVLDLNTSELDHKIPINRGGSFNLDNVGITSKFLNSAKGIMTDEEFKGLLLCTHNWEDRGLYLLKRLVSSNNIYRKYRRR